MAMTEDLSVFFEDDDFAVTATFGAETADVILDAPASDVLGGEMLSTDYAILYPATVLTALARGSSITVNGTAYKVREITPQDDGRIKRATLSKP